MGTAIRIRIFDEIYIYVTEDITSFLQVYYVAFTLPCDIGFNSLSRSFICPKYHFQFALPCLTQFINQITLNTIILNHTNISNTVRRNIRPMNSMRQATAYTPDQHKTASDIAKVNFIKMIFMNKQVVTSGEGLARSGGNGPRISNTLLSIDCDLTLGTGILQTIYVRN